MKRASEIKQIVIVGGGTAGWMSALILADTLAQSATMREASITLLESPVIGTIGVGEGSTHALKRFFDTLRIEESEWMPACHATYKCGITFDGWSTRPGFTSYFHQFSTMVDNLTQPVLSANVAARLRGADAPAWPNDYFLSAYLVKNKLAPVNPEHFPFTANYGFHFDATLLARFLRKKALERGVRHHECHIVASRLDAAGDIASVQTSNGEAFAGDLFIDCSGFAGLLIEQALGTPFISYARDLANDAAVAMPTPHDGDVAPHTVSTALRNGWAWQIPLTSRHGNGYVYSSAYCSADDAEHELRERLGLLDADVPARHIAMKVGRVEQAWRRNCVAIGLAQGFLEPLEATALFLTQTSAAIFAAYLDAGDYGERARDAYNREVNGYFDGHRDYIVAHYKTNSRPDTAYWRDRASNPGAVSDSLRAVFDAWLGGRELGAEITRQGIDKYYPIGSWYALLAGMGIFPPSRPAPPDPALQQQAREMREFLRRCALNFRGHMEVLREYESGSAHAARAA
ncbi:tryptophan 7-halogenase [Massilia sp. G4R7]|uniref:Tryptophan 7-halogenase n=1 Tax=Massilia phyllostachyos TaxID=2898585 RepID=A0ABS8Q6H4_9BURK|nr:tryptophan halogenase family protein [Massilia phyllostachyos]MCD2517347.1 tryptophan 7-halogenase [Massilia phyllostachyos]